MTPTTFAAIGSVKLRVNESRWLRRREVVSCLLGELLSGALLLESQLPLLLAEGELLVVRALISLVRCREQRVGRAQHILAVEPSREPSAAAPANRAAPRYANVMLVVDVVRGPPG